VVAAAGVVVTVVMSPTLCGCLATD
jgi:hypothetical protein